MEQADYMFIMIHYIDYVTLLVVNNYCQNISYGGAVADVNKACWGWARPGLNPGVDTNENWTLEMPPA